MAAPFLLAQLSDFHVGAPASGRDPRQCLRAAIDAVAALPDRPDALLASGDLSDDGSPASYEFVREQLERLGLPYFVLPGNHDDRAALRRCFDLAGEGDDPIQYAADLGPLRLVAVDTVLPGEDRGELDDVALTLIEAELAVAPEQPTLLAMHHPPLHTGIPPFDEICLDAGARGGLAAVLSRHPQVLRIVAGHVHRTIVGELAGRAVLTVPSTYAQARLDFTATDFGLNDDPPGFAVHAFANGEIASHIQPLP
ncbi:MAG TPA: phosphodiesterase [Solirubrobacterales bacterium]|jgi:3',5'-cyclic AMP phosphodiesterase CpdA|nr:phosphodiesterase [Solirubrobacterales bacterium]